MTLVNGELFMKMLLEMVLLVLLQSDELTLGLRHCIYGEQNDDLIQFRSHIR